MPPDMTRLFQLVREGIEKLRLKLLDLTNSNRLLNFKFNDSSRRFVRVIDELPDQLYERLTDEANGRRLYFESLPEVPARPKVEDVALTESEYAAPSPLEPGARRESKEPRINLAEWARENDIDPSYDLPLPTSTSAGRHSDNRIQTLLLPESMDRKLGGIRDDANTATQELGLSTLYAAFGYLEWYEVDRTDEPRFAPLVLLPLHIDRELKQHRYRYFVEGSDATEAVANISLAERLKRDFNFKLPELTSEDTPEEYFRRVSRAIQPFLRWRVRRFVCIGHFSFSRLVMFEDLSAATWQNAPLEENSLISSLLAGNSNNESDSPAVPEEYDVESEEIERILPALITDADSSQHAAIVDAIKGRSFALKGPPGTGKSQTITNLISALLAAGKRVLFVAEKQAALDVVSERLGDAGLSPYLLELHSTKIQKRKVLESFETRLKIRRRRETEELQETLSALRATRSQLRSYVSTMNDVVGNSALTLHDVYWQEQGARRSLPAETTELLRGLENESRGQMTAAAFAAQLDAIDRLAKAYAACTIEAPIKKHALYGINRPGLGSDDAFALHNSLEQYHSALERMSKICVRRDAMLGSGLPATLAGLRDFCSTAESLPDIAPTLDFRLFAPVKEPSMLAALRTFGSTLEKVVREREALGNVFNDLDEALGTSERLVELSAALTAETDQAGLGSTRIPELHGALTSQIQQTESAKHSTSIVEAFFATAEKQTAISSSLLVEIAEAISFLRTLPAHVLTSRSADIAAPDAKPRIERYLKDAHALQLEQSVLSAELNLVPPTEVRDLREASRTLTEANWLNRIISSEYRRAKKMSLRLRKAPWVSRHDAANQMLRLADWLVRKQEFEAQPAAKQLAGFLWNGIATPFGQLSEVADFYAAVRRTWPSLDPQKQPIQGVLLSADALLLSELANSVGEDRVAAIRALHDKLARSAETPARDFLGAYELRLKKCREMLIEVRPDRFRQPFSMPQVALVFKRASLLHRLSQELRQQEFAKSIDIARSPGIEQVSSVAQAIAYCDNVFSLSLPLPLQLQLLSRKAPSLRQAIQSMGQFTRQTLASIDEATASLVATFGLETGKWIGAQAPELETLPKYLQRTEEALSCSEAVTNEWMIYRDVVSQVEQFGLTTFHTLLEAGSVLGGHLPNFFRCMHFRSLVKHASKANPSLPRWTGEAVENQRRRLRDLDREYVERSRQFVFARLSTTDIPAGISQGPVSDKTERALIEHEMGKQRRHIAIRELLRRASAAAQAAKPCFMMSPASVAQFLPASSNTFDVVIIDEASQMRPEEALGVLARARQAIVVGDPMQLPPTTFFDSSHDDLVELDNNELDIDSESVLDLALSSFRPSRELKWHYRSQHHSLIAFSNREFYDDSLIVFPSPIDRSDDMGVKSVYVPDGLYGSSVNVREAAVVVETVVQMIRANPNRSIGVVAVNQPQRELLRQEFDRAFAENDDLEHYRAKWHGTLYPFFIKNLENVQGDERDAIVISTVYGPATSGAAVMQRFGPINSKNGHRRLNVLFTRAKQRVVLVTSLRPEDVVPTGSSSRGAHALKNYLLFARTGRLEHGVASGGSYESPFEKEVAEVVQQLGFKTTPQIGVAGFFIDLGVRHPSNTDHFMLGIECDGASYHSAKSARDRDRLRQDILERLGWQLYRIWSTDWFRSRDKEVKRLGEHLRRLSGALH